MWYDEPASIPGTSTSWQAETLPLGNGTLGGLVYGGISLDRLHFNEKSLWTGGPGSLQSSIQFPASDNTEENLPLEYNGGNRVTAVDPEALEEYRQLLDDKSTSIWGETFNTPNDSGIREVVFGSSRSNPSTQMSRWQDFGDIYMEFPGVEDANAENYVRDLDMRTAISTVNYDYEDVNYSREYFVSYPDDVMVVHLTASEAESLNFKVYTALAEADLNIPQYTNRDFSFDGDDTIVLDGSFKLPNEVTPINTRSPYQALNGLKFAYRLKVINDGGTLTPNVDNSITISDADSVTLIFGCDTDYANEYPEYRTGDTTESLRKRIEDKVEAAAELGYEALKERHVADHSELFSRVEIDLANGFVPSVPTDELVESYGRSMIPEQPYVNVAAGGAVAVSGQYDDRNYIAERITDNNTNTIWISDNSETPYAIITLPEESTFDLLQLASITPQYILEYNDNGDWKAMAVKSTEYELDQYFRNDLVTIEPVTTDKIRVRWDTDYIGLGNKDYMNRTIGEVKAYDTQQPAEIEHIATEEEQRALEVMAYQYGRYLTIAGSREGSLPTNLGGAWLVGSASGLWGSDYHFNINVQMNYWPTLSGNLAECATTLNDYVESLREPGRLTAAQSAGVASEEGEANGFLVNTQNNVYGYTAPSGSQEYGWNISGSTWALQNVFEYYQFTGDVEYLRDKIYPMMKEMANFWEEFLWYSDYQDRLVVSPSISAEQGPTANGTTYDQSFVWQHFENTIKAAEILGVDADKIEQWRSIQEQLDPIQIGDDGQIKEWYEETSIGMAQAGDLPEAPIPNWRAGISPTNSIVPHRHLSHLVGLYPGTLISKDSDQEVIDAAMVSLTERGFGATSWSKSHKINSWARMGMGEESYQMVRSLVGGGNGGLKGNLLASHGNNGRGTINYTASPIFQIDGNFGLASGISEMLLQSQLGYTQFLPAIPDAWSDGSVQGLVARGNFVIGMEWSDNVVESFQVTSRIGGEFIGEYTDLSDFTVTDSHGNNVAVTTLSNDKISFETVEGETYTLTPDDGSSSSTGGGSSTVSSYTITVTQTTGGKISPSTTSVTKGSDKTFTITANEGYKISDVLVDGKSVGALSSYTFENVTARHTITAKFEKVEEITNVGGFIDVKSTDWFAEAVQYAVDNGLMNGTSATTFSPKGDTTRGMIVTILYRQAGSPAVESDGATWWSDARAWAMANGISDGTNMDKPITREQLATMLFRYAELTGEDVSKRASLDSFKDGSKVSAYAVEALQWAAAEGIVTGKTGGVIDPQAGATRAETATMLMRFCELIK